MKKSSIRKILITLFGHLWVVEETFIYIFAFTFRCLQPDIVPIICHLVSLTPVANLPTVSTTQGELVAKFATGVIDTGAWCTLTCEYLR
jgi:hypothetical protein